MEGRTVSHYRILDKLGEGGMGEVYKAVDERLHRPVAIKFSKEGFSSRFVREATNIAALNHPHICSLYDIGEFEGARFLVMEFVEGSRLPSPLPIETALDYAIQITEALEAAHHQGIIHRDLKPANILVTQSGQIKVLDFGLAKHVALRDPDSDETATASVADESSLTAKGVVVGTAAYMSPEQVEGKPVDARSDIFSFGSVLYELLTGARAFQGDSVMSTLSAILRETPVRANRLRKEVPAKLERIVERCLEKNCELRYRSAADLRQDLAACLERTRRSHAGFRALLRKPRVVWPAAVALLILVGGGVWLGVRARRIEWAETKALPEIARLVEQRQFGDAFNLATRAEKVIPGHARLAKVWPEVSVTVSIETEPPGADVEMKLYGDVDKPWIYAGRTPISNLRIAREYFRWRFTKSGLETLEYAGPQEQNFDMKIRLTPERSPESGMVYVPPGTFRVNLSGFGYLGPFPMEAHWIDKFEVTNRRFKQFVDAGGYGNREYWNQPFVKDGRTLTWEQAMALLVDAAGRPGPATWEAGAYADGKDDFPVGGVSWYEAAAYAKFAGKSLPTLYHWYHSAWLSSSSMLYLSNFGRGGPVPVGRSPGITATGLYDMGGNVREWCWNEAKGQRYSLGGAWDDPLYYYLWSELRDPFDRAPGNGFRCVKYVSGAGPPARFAAPIVRPFRDYSKEKPVSEEAFRIFRSIYARPIRPLKPEVLSEDSSAEHWRKLLVAYDAGYGAERMTAYLFLPKQVAPPYQAVVFFPGAGTITERSSRSLQHWPSFLDFVIKSGRALLYPIYKGTYERPAGIVIAEHNREQLNWWVSEVSRSVDYLESRPDVQRGAIAYYGLSWGAHMAPVFLSLEERFKAAFLIVGGLLFRPRTPECDEFNFLPRVKVPVLMINGRDDFIFPFETSVQPFYRLLGTPAKDKRLVVLEAAHNMLPKRTEIMRETLDWLDRYLGTVKR